MEGKTAVPRSLLANSTLFSTVRKNSDSNNDRFFEKLVVNRTESSADFDYWNDFGYKYCGIIVHSFFRWIKKQLARDNKKIICFTKKTDLIERITARIKNDFGAITVVNMETDTLGSMDDSVVIVIDDTDCGTFDGAPVRYMLFGDNATAGTNRYFIDNDRTLEGTQIVSRYTKDVMRFIFSEPTEDDELQSIYDRISDGIVDFMIDCRDLTLPEDLLFSILHYLTNEISIFDEKKIALLKKRNADGSSSNIVRRDHPHIGVVNPWPGDMTAELEVLFRMKIASDNSGIGLYMLDNFGRILDNSTQKTTDEFVDSYDLDFVIATHYETHKTLDSFYYFTIWNPPEITMNLEEYPGRIVNNIISYDDYLIYDSGGMSDQLKTMLINKPRSIEDPSELVASFPLTSLMEPNLSDPKMFYCGMNWEKVIGTEARHLGLFKLLDKTGAVEFYGPDKNPAWGNIRPWGGYECYRGPIPFDGTSILERINHCGICLVLSSNIHRRAGAATNRLYEAIAAGAVILSDDNEFVMKYFKDAAIFIDYNKDNPEDTFNQLMEKYNWIVEHKDEAEQLVRRAQEIFKEKFVLEKQLWNIVNNHPKRFASIASDLFEKDESKTVLVTFVINTLDVEKAREMVLAIADNCDRQYYRNIVLGVAVDEKIADVFSDYLKIRSPRAFVQPMPLFNNKGYRVITDGQAIRSLHDTIEHDYFINTNYSEIWFYDHISTLVRSMEDCPASMGAYSGISMRSDEDKLVRTRQFNTLGKSSFFNMIDGDIFDCPGQFIFKSAADDHIPEYVFSNIDGLEQCLYSSVMSIKYDFKLVFTKRMTLVKKGTKMDVRNAVVPTPMQIRLIRDIVRFEYNECNCQTVYYNYGKIPGTKRGIASRGYGLIRNVMKKLFPSGNYPRPILLADKSVKKMWSVIHGQ